ncbi:MAG: DUF5686 family protein [Bacteroidota bacterium]
MIRHYFLLTIITTLLLGSQGLAQEYSLTGTLRDSVTGQTIVAANIRVLGTARGTVCNTEGAYRLMLPAGDHRIVITSLGYRPDTVALQLTRNTTLDFSLTPSDITLAEILVTGEDPARAIIRQAIANKRRWIDKLQSYEMAAFTRQVLRRDTSIASITEAYTKGYWQRGDTLREVVLQKRQTENIDVGGNFASVGRLLNFYDEDIRFIGYTFVGPIADNAFDHYDYKLLSTRTAHRSEMYEIELIPLSATVPCFTGTISIADGSFALVGVDVEPNQAFLLPFVKEKSIRYRQQFSQYDGSYWLPADIRVDAHFTLGIVGFSFPAIGFTQTSVVTEYSINTPIPDSIFRKPLLVVDSSATTFDSTFWASPTALPLTTEEQTAYATLDSTQTLEAQFRPGGFAMTLGSADGTGVNALSLLDVSFNRIEGAHLGLHGTFDELSEYFTLRGGFAYGFSDKKTKYSIGAEIFPLGNKLFGVGGDFYRLVQPFPEQGYYGNVANSISSLLDKNDYRDYYRTEGWSATLSSSPSRDVKAALSFVHEKHSTAEQTTDYSLFRKSRPYRPNPAAGEGNLRSLRLDFGFGRSGEALDIITRNGVDFSMEYSSPDFASSSFNFLRYHVVGTLVFPTFAQRFLFSPSVRVRLAAGAATGTLPPQRLFSIESASSVYAPFGVMKAMDVKEFGGTSYTAINIEHNFRSLPFLALGIPFLYENNIEFIVHGGIAKSWNNGPLQVNTTDRVYSDMGFGISRIFDLLRCDFTWRLSTPGNFRFTLSVANLF